MLGTCKKIAKTLLRDQFVVYVYVHIGNIFILGKIYKEKLSNVTTVLQRLKYDKVYPYKDKLQIHLDVQFALVHIIYQDRHLPPNLEGHKNTRFAQLWMKALIAVLASECKLSASTCFKSGNCELPCV